MDQALDDALAEAIRAYDYPAITYDFAALRERNFSTMLDLELFLRNLLLSGDLRSLKDGLSGILFWGYYRVPYRDRRVKIFRDEVRDSQLQNANEVFPILEGTGLMQLKRIALPQLRYMAFLTKVRTFLDPDHYCVLDKNIASLGPLAIRGVRRTGVDCAPLPFLGTIYCASDKGLALSTNTYGNTWPEHGRDTGRSIIGMWNCQIRRAT